MRTQDIEVILAIRQVGSFSRAADTLSLSQPAVSLAVKRVEEEIGARIFDRSGPAVVLTPEGARVAAGFERMMEIFAAMKGATAGAGTLRIGLSPLLSGRDVATLLSGYLRSHEAHFAVEFLESEEILTRSDFDVRVVVPGLGRRASARVELQTCWIGADNGVFIRSRQESSVWDRAMHVLVDADVPVRQVIEVNDCGYAYHMASSGAGFTPCVMSGGNGFRSAVLPDLPALAPIQLDVFADPEIAAQIKASLTAPAGERAPVLQAVR